MSGAVDGALAVTLENDIIAARRQVRRVAGELGFGITDVTRIVTAVSELTRNVYQHAGGGTVRWRRLDRDGRVGIEVAFEDEGPGIADLDKALEEGFTSGRGLGMGLSGSKRLMDELEISSAVGSGTRIVVRKWLR